MKIDKLVIKETNDGFCLEIETELHGNFPLNDEVYRTEQEAINAKYIAEKQSIALFN